MSTVQSVIDDTVLRWSDGGIYDYNYRVTAAGGGPANIKSYMGVLKAAIGKINGVSYARIVRLNGVA
jgi:hypothetical protein